MPAPPLSSITSIGWGLPNRSQVSMSVSRHSPLHSIPPVGSQIDSITIEATADAISPADAARSPPSACTIPGDCPYRRNTPKSSSAITHPHSTHPAVAAIAPSHPLATRSPLSLDDLLTAELLLREPGSAIRDAFDSALLLRGRCAEPAWTSVNFPALAAAREGLGVAGLPACLTEADVAAGRLVRLEVEGLTLRNQNQLVVHRDKTITPPLRLFMEAVTAEEG